MSAAIRRRVEYSIKKKSEFDAFFFFFEKHVCKGFCVPFKKVLFFFFSLSSFFYLLCLWLLLLLLLFSYFFFFLLSAWQAGLAINRVSTLSRVVFNVREKGERERGGMKTNMADPNQKRRKKKQKANNKKKKKKKEIFFRDQQQEEKRKREGKATEIA